MAKMTKEQLRTIDDINTLGYDIFFTVMPKAKKNRKKAELIEKLLQVLFFSQSAAGMDTTAVNGRVLALVGDTLQESQGKNFDKHPYEGEWVYTALQYTYKKYENREIDEKTGKPKSFYDIFLQEYKNEIKRKNIEEWRKSDLSKTREDKIKMVLKLCRTKFHINATFPDNVFSDAKCEHYLNCGTMSPYQVEEAMDIINKIKTEYTVATYEDQGGSDGWTDEMAAFVEYNQDMAVKKQAESNVRIQLVQLFHTALNATEDVHMKNFSMYFRLFLTAMILCKNLKATPEMKAFMDKDLIEYYFKRQDRYTLKKQELVAYYLGLQPETVRKKFAFVEQWLLKHARELHMDV